MFVAQAANNLGPLMALWYIYASTNNNINIFKNNKNVFGDDFKMLFKVYMYFKVELQCTLSSYISQNGI